MIPIIKFIFYNNNHSRNLAFRMAFKAPNPLAHFMSNRDMYHAEAAINGRQYDLSAQNARMVIIVGEEVKDATYSYIGSANTNESERLAMSISICPHIFHCVRVGTCFIHAFVSLILRKNFF